MLVTFLVPVKFQLKPIKFSQQE